MTAGILEATVSARTGQLVYVEALARVLDRATRLPLLVWTVYPFGLHGRAVCTSDTATITAVQTWAAAYNQVAVIEAQPMMVEHRGAYSVGWRLEPGQITARLSDHVTVSGELLEVLGGAL